MKSCHPVATVCGFISLLLLIIALGSDHWVDVNNFNVGLWKACTKFPFGIVCNSVEMNVSGYVHATRAFLIFGMFAGFISCGLLSLLFFRTEIGSYPVARSASISSYVAGVLALLAMAIFTGGGGASSSYGWSFGLGWVCGPLFLVTGGLAQKLQTHSEF